MKAVYGAVLASFLASSGAYADGGDLVGTLWLCTRANDRTQFAITFHPGGGVGGGEFQRGEVSPYVFDATNMKEGQWPGRWEQKERSFTWSFPDQHMTITGLLKGDTRGPRIEGTESSSAGQTAITCLLPAKALRVGDGLTIPQDGHFMDLNRSDAVLKVPTGISLQPPQRRR